MNDLWLSIKAWIKAILIALIVLYALLFIYNNSGEEKHVQFWWWFNRTHATTVFMLALWAFLAGVVTTVVVKTTWTTLRQIRQVRSQARLDRLERQMADTRAKAAMLQPNPAAAPIAPVVAPPGPLASDGVTMQVDRLGHRT